MRITTRNILYHELIGLEVEILNHPDPGLIGLKGIIRWETSKTIVVRKSGEDLVILKSGGLFRFKLPNGETVVVRGDNLIGTPQERARRIVRGRK